MSRRISRHQRRGSKHASASRTQGRAGKPAGSALAGLMQRAVDHHRKGRLADARTVLQELLNIDDRHAQAWHLLGLVSIGLGQVSRAEETLRKAYALAPGDASICANLGSLLLEIHRPEESQSFLRRALDIQPDMPHAMENLATALVQSGDPDEAIAWLESVRQKYPSRPNILLYLGRACQVAERLDDALEWFRLAAEQQPGNVTIASDRGACLSAMGRYEEAVDLLREALRVDATHAGAWCNLGAACRYLHWNDEAEAALRTALRLDPDYPPALNNLPVVLEDLGRFDESEQLFRYALELQPADAVLRFGLSLLHLRQGRYEEAWENYDSRFDRDVENSSPRRPFDQPIWNGRAPAGRILLWGEQGVGDEVMFAGILSELDSRGWLATVECTDRLVPLFSRSFPKVSFVPCCDPPDPRCFAADITCQLPLGSLPKFFRRSEEEFPGLWAYLRADQDRSEVLRNRYRSGDGPVVGISWRSGNFREGRRRSLPLEQWEPMFHSSNARFVSLQYGADADEISLVSDRFGVDILLDEEVDPLADLDTFASQVAAMDLVISIDNSTVHFAGALGVPCWVLLPRSADWRWLTARENSPWYPSLWLLRQPDHDHWQPVVQRAADALTTFCRDFVPAWTADRTCRPVSSRQPTA